MESIRELLQEMRKIKLGAGAKQKRGKAQADLKKTRKKCESESAACGLLKDLAEENTWDGLLAYSMSLSGTVGEAASPLLLRRWRWHHLFSLEGGGGILTTLKKLLRHPHLT